MTRSFLLSLLLLVTALVSACGGDSASPTHEPTPTLMPVPTPTATAVLVAPTDTPSVAPTSIPKPPPPLRADSIYEELLGLISDTPENGSYVKLKNFALARELFDFSQPGSNLDDEVLEKYFFDLAYSGFFQQDG